MRVHSTPTSAVTEVASRMYWRRGPPTCLATISNCPSPHSGQLEGGTAAVHAASGRAYVTVVSTRAAVRARGKVRGASMTSEATMPAESYLCEGGGAP